MADITSPDGQAPAMFLFRNRDGAIYEAREDGTAVILPDVDKPLIRGEVVEDAVNGRLMHRPGFRGVRDIPAERAP